MPQENLAYEEESEWHLWTVARIRGEALRVRGWKAERSERDGEMGSAGGEIFTIDRKVSEGTLRVAPC